LKELVAQAAIKCADNHPRIVSLTC